MMNTMICLRGEPEQLPYLPAIAELGAGIELGSYGLVGIRSEQDWQARLRLHEAVRAQFEGLTALHGPFIGMEFAHADHLIRAAVQQRMDRTFDAARQLRASRVILHAGFTRELELFDLHEVWLQGNIAYWRQEIMRWADAGMEIVLENVTERAPDLLVRLVEAVDHPALGLCLDVGHQHVFSELGAVEWVRQMGSRLYHVHLHDNDSTKDAHWPIGRGTIQFEPFFAALRAHAPHATLSLEVEDQIEVKLADLRKVIAAFTSKPRAADMSA
jgi:sugar phosphate isomerase/epimerase